MLIFGPFLLAYAGLSACGFSGWVAPPLRSSETLGLGGCLTPCSRADAAAPLPMPRADTLASFSHLTFLAPPHTSAGLAVCFRGRSFCEVWESSGDLFPVQFVGRNLEHEFFGGIDVEGRRDSMPVESEQQPACRPGCAFVAIS